MIRAFFLSSAGEHIRLWTRTLFPSIPLHFTAPPATPPLPRCQPPHPFATTIISFCSASLHLNPLFPPWNPPTPLLSPQPFPCYSHRLKWDFLSQQKGSPERRATQLASVCVTAGHLCPQPVNLHLQEDAPPRCRSTWIIRGCVRKEKTNPSTVNQLLHPREGKGQRTGGHSRHRPPTSHRLESQGRLSIWQTNGGRFLLLLLSSISEPIALSFTSGWRLWTIQLPIATIKENKKKKELSRKQNVKYKTSEVMSIPNIQCI